MSARNQKQIVLGMLRQGAVTRFNAYQAGILNVTARIADLRNDGCEIHCSMVTSPLHHNGNTEFGRWTLVSEPRNGV